jgi:flagellar FliJ protein
MKKYAFKLEPVLKLRKLKEENCRTELGQLIGHLAKIDKQIEHDKDEIENFFNVQNISLTSGVKGSQIQSFPLLISAKEKNIQLLLRDRTHQEQLIEAKKKELATLRGELKVIENLKDKDYQEYRKAFNKEQDQKVEEQTQNWLQFKDRNN